MNPLQGQGSNVAGSAHSNVVGGQPRFGIGSGGTPEGVSNAGQLLPVGCQQQNTSQIFGNTGVSINSLPLQQFVSVALKKDILAGKDINLAALLIPNFKEATPREVTIGEESLSIKPSSDKRLTRSLTQNEFSVAFNKYQDIVSEVYPSRRRELAQYHTSIIKMANQYGGVGFYEYHKQFSFNASQYLLQQGIKVDWGIRDNDLFMSIFTGQKVISCETCGNFSHSTNFCPDRSDSSMPKSTWSKGSPGNNYPNRNIETGSWAKKDKKGRSIITLKTGKQLCNNYNTSEGCPFADRCHFTHICSKCHKAHPVVKCFAGQKNTTNTPHSKPSSNIKVSP
jgi:hypothetical protein